MASTNRKLFDISPEVSPQIAVFPGDTPFAQKILMDCKKGDHLGLSSFTTTPHVGAHVDAPNHYHRDGKGISERSLEYYFGPCQVFEVSCPRGTRIHPADIKEHAITSARILFKTQSFPNPNQWNNDFVSLSKELIDYLAAHNVRLVGIDTPSIDLADDKELESHHAVYQHDMAILEGIVLEDVPPGKYDLVALPLKMKNLDASPVRAVLVQS
ncbi:MAG: cyclase family protein [Bdellovibrionaceae bacterium]|nr:cyclase family protein [Pseudobdellovibrionaceae bacterium]